jgi:hypothetical protein
MVLDRNMENSVRWVLPRRIMPAARSFLAIVESSRGRVPHSAKEPAVIIVSEVLA